MQLVRIMTLSVEEKSLSVSMDDSGTLKYLRVASILLKSKL